MLINSDCTIYLYDKSTGGFIRQFVPKVYWRNCKSSNILKSGMQISDTAKIYLYSDEIRPKSLGKDMLVKGNCNFEFDNTSAKSVSESMKIFRENYEFVTVNSVDISMFGGLPHIEISAK